MNGVLGMADLLMDTNLTEDQRQMGRVIQSSAQNLLTIIDDLLDFSKVEAGKFRLTADEFNLTEQVIRPWRSWCHARSPVTSACKATCPRTCPAA
jgi:signal transduction histidine kinase